MKETNDTENSDFKKHPVFDKKKKRNSKLSGIRQSKVNPKQMIVAQHIEHKMRIAKIFLSLVCLVIIAWVVNMFIQEQTPFEIPDEPAYFIPDKANGCTEVGCEQFTNLDTEQIEYFSEMRFCAKPAGEIPVFYTWEGSDEAGYQLKVWNLAKDGNAPACAGSLDCECNETEYKINPDCRQFYGVEGEIYYRYYSQTITITEDCHPYRQTQRISDTDCGNLGGEFDANTQSCTYNGYPKESVACSVSENGCREYKGNYAENIAIIFNDNFEDGATGDWGGEGGASFLFGRIVFYGVVGPGFAPRVPPRIRALIEWNRLVWGHAPPTSPGLSFASSLGPAGADHHPPPRPPTSGCSAFRAPFRLPRRRQLS